MITGDGTTAAYTRELFGDVPWLWICDDAVTVDGHYAEYANLCDLRQRIYKSALTDVVISTQIPVGTCAKLEEEHPDRKFAVIPENFRTTKTHPHVDRFIVGTRDTDLWALIHKRLFRYRCLLMSPESAEMVKHALNGFLALSIQYANEIAELATKHDADPVMVAAGLQSDPRIGTRSYLKPEGGQSAHLIREVHNLAALGGGPLIDTLEGLVT